nr:L-dopachrome tautomerase-related protein [Nostoc sp. DedSLP05]MDZ8101930.1 L-dopachrome tautomerase-related protein [Nostoc sp. DedSLP01]
MLTGVTVSHQGRIFVNFPKWGDEVAFTVAEIRDGRPVAYPNEEINRPNPDNLAQTLVSVQSVVVDSRDRLWILDTGSPMFQPTQYGGPKLVCVDLTSDRVIKTILFPQNVALPTTYLNDIRLQWTATGTFRIENGKIAQFIKDWNKLSMWEQFGWPIEECLTQKG